MKNVYLVCLCVCAVSLWFDNSVVLGCVIEGKTYANGVTVNIGCSSQCKCNEADAGFSCTRMCPRLPSKSNCMWVVNPDRDVPNSKNCCPIQDCW